VAVGAAKAMAMASMQMALGLFGQFGWQEMLFILIVILVLFGGKKLPELARGLGKGMREFKKELRGVKDDVEEAVNTEDEPARTPPDQQLPSSAAEADKDEQKEQ